MFLGTIMQDLAHEQTALAAFVALDDIVLVAQVDATAVAFEEDRGAYVSGAVRRFAQLATDEDWLRLMTTLERSTAPAADGLRTMVRWSIDRDTAACGPYTGCTCGGGDGGCHGET